MTELPQGALGAAGSYLLPVLLVSAPFSYFINRRIAAVMAGTDPGGRQVHGAIECQR